MALRLFASLWCCLLAFAERRQRSSLAIALLGAALVSGFAHADCAGARLYDVQGAYEEAMALERSGSVVAALAAYVRAQEPTCGANPVELESAWRAAALALPLGRAAEQAGRLRLAFDYYEAGGHFDAADRALVALIHSRPDDVALYDEGVRHFSNRSLPAFAAHQRARLAVTGPYTPDATHVARLHELPAKRAMAALAAESKKFDASYLGAVVRLEGIRANASSDLRSIEAAAVARREFAARWPADPLAESRRLLHSAREWARRDQNASRGRGFETRVALRYADRAHTLARAYSAAPSLLQAALDYIRESAADAAIVASDLVRVRTVARRLAQQSARAEHHLAASEYYEVAGDHEQAAAARGRDQAIAQSRFAPGIEMAPRRAFERAVVSGTPAQIEALQPHIDEAIAETQRSNAAQDVTEM